MNSPFNIILRQFIDLCEIPELYEGLARNLMNIAITPIRVYNYGVSVGVTVDCTNFLVANGLSLHRNVLIEAIQRLHLTAIKVTVKKEYCWGFINYPFLVGTMTKNLDIDFNGLYASTNPVYLIAMHNEKLLFANPAALLANQKKPDEFFGDNVAALGYPEELEYRKRMLRQDGQLTSYEYKAMNWYKDGEIWRRREMRLVADIQKIDFGGVECRLGVDLMVEETRRFID